jgi:hypothetical protein
MRGPSARFAKANTLIPIFSRNPLRVSPGISAPPLASLRRNGGHSGRAIYADISQKFPSVYLRGFLPSARFASYG